MTARYKVGIVGAGMIAAGYDAPGSPKVLTHAHAFKANPRFDCLGFFDLDQAKARAAASKWGLGHFATFEALASANPDVVVICVPDEHHASSLRPLLEQKVRLVLCEKPLTLKVTDSRALMEAFARKKVALGINYQRRYDPSLLAVRQAYTEGRLGRFVCGTVLYSKGILHNGSHAVDTLRFLLGDPTSAVVTRKIADYKDADPTVDATLDFGAGSVALVAGDERLFSLFEIDLLFEKRRYRFHHSGLSLDSFEVKDDPVFPGYRELFATHSGPSELGTSLSHMVQNLADSLDGKAGLRCEAASVIGTQAVCEALAHAPIAARLELPK